MLPAVHLHGCPKLKQQSRLVVDATGVGAPVVELLRSAGLGARVTAVTITGGERAHGLSQGGSEHWLVPRKDLLPAGLEVLLLEAADLKISRRVGLACWRARAERSEGGRERLPGM